MINRAVGQMRVLTSRVSETNTAQSLRQFHLSHALRFIFVIVGDSSIGPESCLGNKACYKAKDGERNLQLTPMILYANHDMTYC